MRLELEKSLRELTQELKRPARCPVCGSNSFYWLGCACADNPTTVDPAHHWHPAGVPGWFVCHACGSSWDAGAFLIDRNPGGRVIDQADLERRFRSHDLTAARKADVDEVRQLCLDLARRLVEIVPAGREQAVTLTKLEEAQFWANAGIARAGDRETG